MAIILQTSRLILRLQQASDIDFLVGLWTDPEVTAYLGGPRDRDWLLAEFQQTALHPTGETYDLWPLVESKTLRPIGHCGLLEKTIEDKDEIELNYVLARSAWGRGYATEAALALKQHAFEQLGLKRLVSLIHPENEASQRVAVRAGLQFERLVERPDGASRRLYSAEIP